MGGAGLAGRALLEGRPSHKGTGDSVDTRLLSAVDEVQRRRPADLVVSGRMVDKGGQKKAREGGLLIALNQLDRRSI